MEKENAKIRKTKGKLISAFLKLIDEMPAEQIGVAELCRRAGVNRTTFYKYYALPMDIAEEYLSGMLAEKLREVRGEKMDTYDILLELCRGFQASPSAMRLLASPVGMETALVRFLKELAGSASLREAAPLYFVCGGISAVLCRWSRFEPEIPAEEIAKKVDEYVGGLVGKKHGKTPPGTVR